MTIEKLRDMLNKEYDDKRVWPTTWEVDTDTWINVVQGLFDLKSTLLVGTGIRVVEISLSQRNNIIFKGTELILTKDKDMI